MLNKMNKLEIIKNLKQIKKLLEEDSPYMAKERINWLIDDIEKGINNKWIIKLFKL